MPTFNYSECHNSLNPLIINNFNVFLVNWLACSKFNYISAKTKLKVY